MSTDASLLVVVSAVVLLSVDALRLRSSLAATKPNPTELRQPDTRGYDNYFQEIYMVRPSPELIEFGHVCENDDEWEQRYEKKDFDRNRHQGKVRWADRRGSRGEHYWDYNHPGAVDTTTENIEEGRVVSSTERIVSSTENSSPAETTVRQHRKRELDREPKAAAWPREADDFVEGFNKEIGIVFHVDLTGKTAPRRRDED